MADIVVDNCILIPVIPRGKILKGYSILIEAGTIVAVDTAKKIRKGIAGHDRIDAKNCVVIPGLINSHTHLPETLLRGICDDQPLQKWLWDYVWVMESKLTKKDAFAGALLGCVELVKNGVTAFIDQFYFAAEIADAVRKVGLRALLCPSVFDNNPEAGSIENCFRRACEVIKEWHGKEQNILFGIGPHAPYTVPKELLCRIKEFAEKMQIPVHMHMNETNWEIENALKQFKKRPFEYLEEIGFLEVNLLAAHCVHLSGREIKLLKKHNVSVLHNPTSNLKLAAGVAQIAKLLENGINVAIGTDGCASNNNLDVLEELMLSAILQKNLTNNPSVLPLETVLQMGTINGAIAMQLSDKTGSIEVGKLADITVVDFKAAHLAPLHNPLSNLIYSAKGSDVKTVIVGGKVLMEDRKMLAVDEEKVVEEAFKTAERLRD